MSDIARTVQKQEKYKELYAGRRASTTPEKLCKQVLVSQDEFETWLDDKRFVDELLAIDRRRIWKLRELFARNLDRVGKNIALIAAESDGTRAINAAKLILEVLEVTSQWKRPQVNVQTNIVNSPTSASDEELLREHERLKSLLATQSGIVEVSDPPGRSGDAEAAGAGSGSE